ncbi:surface lipoprotein assembly modifier [Psychrobacter immobilis]|uniref:surface lipoprotein assembly modifier n=1 Tax=Psychrobacter immobilis TaxID=498 RepID=UPI00191930E6|nr:porin family protein [Psychrobacter immobilis]
MQYFRHSDMYSALAFIVSCSAMNLQAAEPSTVPLAPQDNSIETINKLINQSRPDEFERLPTDLPSDDSGPKMSKEESKAYLKANPAEFEKLLSNMLRQANAESLEELLPVYQQVPNYDPSVIDWGNAIIAAKKGKLDEAVTMYRKVNAQLPEVQILRFQLAMALYYNRQFDAAQSEFEALRSEAPTEDDVKVINNYLNAINAQDRWSFNGSVSYMDDSNITNSPEQGTQIVRPDGSVLTYTSPRESGKGFNFNASGDRKWLYDNKIFTTVNLNSYGKYYWDNKDYNDVTAGIGAGIGYQNAVTEVEIGPFYNKRWYAQGKSGDGGLQSYADTTGIKLSANQWLSPKLRYQGLARYAKSSYIDKYEFNDGEDWLLANTAVYLPNGQQFWTFGVDYSTRDSEDDSLAYDRPGVRVGWGQTWPKGYTTRLDLGYAERNYDGADFFGIQRENKEYSAGITAWNRGFSFLGLTPRLSWNYNKVTSNSPFEEYDKNDVSVELTKAF